MNIAIELTEESRDLLMRHFRGGTPLHEILKNAARQEISGISVFSFTCDPTQADELLEMARNHCPPAVKDIDHAIDAAKAR